MEDIGNRIIECLENIGIIIDYTVHNDVDLTEYGLDSLTYISFIVEVEKLFMINIPDEYLQIETLSSLKGFIGMVENLILECKC